MKKIMILCIALLLTSCTDEKLDEPIQRDDLVEEDLFGDFDVSILYIDAKTSQGMCEAMINDKLLQGSITFKEDYDLQTGDKIAINNYNFKFTLHQNLLVIEDEGKTYKFSPDFVIEGAEVV